MILGSSRTCTSVRPGVSQCAEMERRKSSLADAADKILSDAKPKPPPPSPKTEEEKNVAGKDFRLKKIFGFAGAFV